MIMKATNRMFTSGERLTQYAVYNVYEESWTSRKPYPYQVISLPSIKINKYQISINPTVVHIHIKH